jgi:hypothetical protein
MPISPLSPSEENIRLKKELELAYLKIRVLEERLRLQRNQQVRAEEREAQRCTAGIAGSRARRQCCRGGGREQARAAAGETVSEDRWWKRKTSASRTSDAAAGSAPRRTTLASGGGYLLRTPAPAEGSHSGAPSR